MKINIDSLKIEGSETSFEILRINCEMCARAFNTLAKLHNNSPSFIDMEIEYHNKAQAIAECLGGAENDK